MGKTRVDRPGRFPRRAFIATLAMGAMVIALSAFREASPLLLTLVPVRVAILLGLLVATLREWLSQRTAESALFWIALSFVLPRMLSLRDASLELAAYTTGTGGTVVITLALLVAPARQRLLWPLMAAACVLVPAAFIIAPADPRLFLNTTGYLALIGLLLTVLEANARRSDTTWDLAYTDELTELENRRAMDLHLREAIRRFGEADVASTIVMLDLDHFKTINDTRGHEAGDDALRQVADVLQRSIRPQDRAARWGGEEFVVVLNGSDETAAEKIAHRLRAAIELETEVTASFGVAQIVDGDHPQAWIDRADGALYAAKESGRNTVVTVDQTPDLEVTQASRPRRHTG